MRFIIILLCFTLFCCEGYGQKGKLNLSDSCSNVIGLVSYYWKLDSLANNGFRLYAYKRLLNCKIDKLNVSTLLENLGRPNKISKTNQGTQYIYFYYDSKAMPKEKDYPFECAYIYFLLDDTKGCLISIGEGVLDY